jgi:hypothetical protein
VSARDLTTLEPGTRKLEEFARRMRALELGKFRGPNSSFGLPFQIGDWVFAEDVNSNLAVLRSGLPGLAVDSLASEAWTSWTPTPRQAAGNLTQNLIYANFEVFSKLCVVELNTTITSTGSAGTEIDVLHSGLPTPADVTYRPVGVGVYFDLSALNWYRVLVMLASGKFQFLRFDASGATNMGVTPAITANFGDIIFFQAFYRTT